MLRELSELVCKDGVSLGLLPAQPQALSLALAWAALPADAVLNEPQMNELLKAWLADSGAFLRTDHVELRRWLADGGWLQRDGFGREYRRVPLPYLPAHHHDVAQAVAALAQPQWVHAQRDAAQQRREAKRAAWQQRQASAGLQAGA